MKIITIGKIGETELRVAVPFLKYELNNFGSIKDEEKKEIKKYLENSKNATSVSLMIKEINKLSKTTSETPDMGLKFFGFAINLIAAGPESLRKELANPGTDDLKEDLLKVKNKSMEEISVEAIDKFDLPRGYDIIINWYQKMFLAMNNPHINSSGREDISKEILSASRALQKGEPELKPLYDLLDTYANKAFLNDPELTFVINAIYRLFVEAFYGERYCINKDIYNELCKKIGYILSDIGNSLRNRDRIETYNNIFKLFQLIENKKGMQHEIRGDN